MKFRFERIRIRVLLFCFWLAISPAVLDIDRAFAADRVSRELTEEVLPSISIEEQAGKLNANDIGIFPTEYLKDQLTVLGRNKDEIVRNFLVFLSTEMGAVFSGLDAKGSGLEILTLYTALSLTFNIAAGVTTIYNDMAAIQQFKSDTLGKFDFYKGLADKVARYTFGGWLFKRSKLTQMLGVSTKSYLHTCHEVGGLLTVLQKYHAVKAYNLSDDSCDLIVEGFKKAGNSPTMKIFKGVGDVLGFVDLAFSAFSFAGEQEWGYLFRDGQMTYQQIKVTIDLACSILGLACFSLAPWAVVALILVSVVFMITDAHASGLRTWVVNFIDCHKILADNDPTFVTLIGQVDQKWSGSFPQKVYSLLQKQVQQYPPEVYPSDAVKQLEGLKEAILERFRVCRHYNAFSINDIDYRNNLKVIADKWKTKAEAQSESWWWPQFNPFASRQEAAEAEYFSSWFHGSQKIGDDKAKWCYFNYDFFLQKLFQLTLNGFETSDANREKIMNNPVIQLVQNRIQVAPFHYFPLALNLMGFFNAGSRAETIEQFIYLCHYSLELDLAITGIRESGYFATYLTALSEQFSDLSSGMEKMRDNCFGLTTEDADYIRGSDLLKELVFNYVDDPDAELRDEKMNKYREILNLKEPADEEKTWKGLVKKNKNRINAIISLLPLKALAVSAKIALLKVLVKQHFVRRAFLTACVSRFTRLEMQLAKDNPFEAGEIAGLGAQPAEYPPGRDFLDAKVTVNAQDKEGVSHAIEFDFTAGGLFWNPGSNLRFTFKDNLEQIREAHRRINDSLQWMELLVTRGGYYANTDLPLEKVNEHCARVMKNMFELTKKIEQEHPKDLKVTFASGNGRVYLTGDKSAYPDFDVTDSVPRVFATPDLVFSLERGGPLDEVKDTGVPDFDSLMNEEAGPIEEVINLPGMTITP